MRRVNLSLESTKLRRMIWIHSWESRKCCSPNHINYQLTLITNNKTWMQKSSQELEYLSNNLVRRIGLSNTRICMSKMNLRLNSKTGSTKLTGVEDLVQDTPEKALVMVDWSKIVLNFIMAAPNLNREETQGLARRGISQAHRKKAVGRDHKRDTIEERLVGLLDWAQKVSHAQKAPRQVTPSYQLIASPKVHTVDILSNQDLIQENRAPAL